MFRSACRHKARHLLTVNWRAVPDDHQLACEFMSEMLQKSHTIGAVQGPGAHQRVKLPGQGDPAHYRQVVVGQKRFEYGRLPARGISPDHTGQQVKARLVNQDNSQALLTRLFFSTGQTSTRHFLTASSSRWLARSIGSCGVHCNPFNNRATCALWYKTPNSSRITARTRMQVQSWPRNPYASAPWLKRSGIVCRCSYLSF